MVAQYKLKDEPSNGLLAMLRGDIEFVPDCIFACSENNTMSIVVGH